MLIPKSHSKSHFTMFAISQKVNRHIHITLIVRAVYGKTIKLDLAVM